LFQNYHETTSTGNHVLKSWGCYGFQFPRRLHIGIMTIIVFYRIYF
jgi:hypothetical protein